MSSSGIKMFRPWVSEETSSSTSSRPAESPEPSTSSGEAISFQSPEQQVFTASFRGYGAGNKESPALAVTESPTSSHFIGLVPVPWYPVPFPRHDYWRCLDAEVPKEPKPPRVKKYRCSYCNTSFSNNGQLKGHVRTHTGERPFKCDEEGCVQAFTRNEELTRHKRIHSGLRPFACQQCDKKFGRKDHLKKHLLTHYRNMYPLYQYLY